MCALCEGWGGQPYGRVGESLPARSPAQQPRITVPSLTSRLSPPLPRTHAPADEPVQAYDQLDDSARALVESIQERQAYIAAGALAAAGSVGLGGRPRRCGGCTSPRVRQRLFCWAGVAAAGGVRGGGGGAQQPCTMHRAPLHHAALLMHP